MKRITVTSTVVTLLSISLFIIILSGKNCDECFSAPVMMVKLIASGLVFLIGSIYFTKLYLHYEKSIFDIETMPLLETNEAAEGTPFSCEGTVHLDEKLVLKSPYMGMPCVYYHSITEEQRGSGKNRHWVVVENLVSISPFYISDKRGKIKVDPTNLDHDFSGYKIDYRDRSVPDPANSEIDCTRVLSGQMVNHTTTLLGIPVTTTGNRRRSEFILPPLSRVFAHGFVTKKDGELVIAEHPRHPLIISQKTKEAYVNEFYKGKNLVFATHLLAAIGFTVTVLAANYFLKLHPVALINVLVTGNWLLVISIVFTMYNRLITLSQRARYALHDIDIELKRRSDLIPKIVELVKTYSHYEKDLQELITQMRVHAVFLQSLPEGSRTLTAPLAAVIEKYPDLKAQENFRSLMINLVDTEERIAYARAFYNRNVRKLNTLVAQFPFIVISALCNIKPMEFIVISPDEVMLPAVKV